MRYLKQLTAAINKLDDSLSKEDFARIVVTFAEIQTTPIDKAQLFMPDGWQMVFIHKDNIHSAARAHLNNVSLNSICCPDSVIADAIGVSMNLITNARRAAENDLGSDFADCFSPSDIDRIVDEYQRSYSFAMLFTGRADGDILIGDYYMFYF